MNILGKGKYYGSMKKETVVNGIVLSEYAYKIPKTDWHYHENPYFMYLLDGNLFDVNKKRKSVCPPGSLLFHNWQEQHYNEKESQDARGFHIEFDRKWFTDHQLDVSLWSGSARLEHPLLHQLIGKLYYEFHAEDAYSELGIESLLIALCENVELHRELESDQNPIWMGQLKEILHESTHKLTLKSLAEELGIHPVHLSRTVPKFLGMTLSEYQRRLKIKKSLIHLSNPRLSLTEVSYLAGFYDQSHFTALFKSCFGFTPKHFRRSVTGGQPC